ncbi:MAG: ankyrin repeat domain-containing protein [Alphaproteobacteria bacterium]
MTGPLLPEQKNALNEALRLAMSSNDMEMMGLAVDNGAEVGILLFTGIEKREKDWVKLALDKGADPDAKKSGWLSTVDSSGIFPAVYWLCENFNSEVGDALVAKGVNIDATANENKTALHWAAARGTRASIEWFIANGANPLAACDNGKTPMQMLGNNSKITSADRTELTKLMLKAMSAKNAPATPAGDFNQVSTKDAIEVSKPIELKKRPGGGGLNL